MDRKAQKRVKKGMGLKKGDGWGQEINYFLFMNPKSALCSGLRTYFSFDSFIIDLT